MGIFKHTKKDPRTELIQKIKKESRDVKAFGGGMASNVVRLFMREKAKGQSSTFVQSRSTNKSSQLDYAFYARMNMCSAAAFAAVRDFMQYIVSQVTSSPGWRTLAGGGVAKPIIPRILLNVDRSEGAVFNDLHAWMKACHTRAKKEFNDAPFASITVVEGASATPLDELILSDGWLIKNMHSHACELGLVHALDVAIGMGDRLQNPNPGNVTLNPKTEQLVVIDVDSCLPPKGLGKKIEDLCVLTTADCGTGLRNNEAWYAHSEIWPPCPPRVPMQGNYKHKVSDALAEDLTLYLGKLQRMEAHFSKEGKFNGKPLAALAKSSMKAYLTLMSNTLHRTWFMRAATLTLQEIKRGVNSGTFAIGVEDPTCSGQRLRERVNQWTFG